MKAKLHKLLQFNFFEKFYIESILGQHKEAGFLFWGRYLL